MIYLIYGIVVALSLVFLALPFLRGANAADYFESSDKLKNKELEKEQNIKDKIESTKLSLRDLDMENKIGKISNDDYEVLKSELLDEWKSADDEYNELKKSDKNESKKES